MVWRKQDSFDVLHEERVAKKLNDILQNDTNPLNAELDSRLNIHSCHYRATEILSSRYGNSFASTAISVFNQLGRGDQADFRTIE